MAKLWNPARTFSWDQCRSIATLADWFQIQSQNNYMQVTWMRGWWTNLVTLNGLTRLIDVSKIHVVPVSQVQVRDNTCQTCHQKLTSIYPTEVLVPLFLVTGAVLQWWHPRDVQFLEPFSLTLFTTIEANGLLVRRKVESTIWKWQKCCKGHWNKFVSLLRRISGACQSVQKFQHQKIWHLGEWKSFTPSTVQREILWKDIHTAWRL